MAATSFRRRFPIALYLASLAFLVRAEAAQYYVATSGDDNNPGTLAMPFATLSKAHSVMVAGDTVLVRGGVYPVGTTTTLSKSGTTDNRFHLLAYPGERPILDCSQMVVGSSNRGIRVTGSYWHIRGIDIKGAGDNGMIISGGSYNIVEHCAFYENADTGLQLADGASHNQIINCDSYNNTDPGQGNADGFAPKLNVGTGNYFYGCRAWNNSDDGFDGYLRPADSVETVLENCWIFANGYLADGSPSIGNGSGFKLGGGDDSNADSLRHNITLINCLAFDNRASGFHQNNNRGSMNLLNCTAYRNGTNYSLGGAVKAGSVVTLTNNLVLGNRGSVAAHAVQTTNSWNLSLTATEADFVSADTTGVRGPRKADGSLPDVTFMHLAYGSPLIDAGTDVGIPFKGTNPDLGCFESDHLVHVASSASTPLDFTLSQNFPNPFNPSTSISFSIPARARTVLTVHDILGRAVATLVEADLNPGAYEATWDAGRFSSGVYFYRLVSGDRVQIRRMALVK